MANETEITANLWAILYGLRRALLCFARWFGLCRLGTLLAIAYWISVFIRLNKKQPVKWQAKLRVAIKF